MIPVLLRCGYDEQAADDVPGTGVKFCVLGRDSVWHLLAGLGVILLRLSKKRKQQLANMSLDQLRQVLIRDIRKIPRAKIKRMLRGYQYCQQRIDGNLDHIQQLRSRMQKVTVTYHDAPGGGTGADAAELIGKILQLENMVKADTERLRYELTEVQFWIDSLENYQERSVLQLRYVNGYDWPDIADRLYYSLDGIFDIHDRALKNLLDLYKKHSKTQ